MIKALIKECGATGKTPIITIGNVITLEHDKKARVEITGDRENPVLNFYLPKGKDGTKLVLRESFNGDIEVVNSLSEIPDEIEGKKVLGIEGIKELIDKVNNNEALIEEINNLLQNKVNEINYNKTSIDDINNILDELQSSIDENTRDIEILKNGGTGGDVSSEAVFLLSSKIDENKKQIDAIKKLAENNKSEIDIIKSSNDNSSFIDIELLNRLAEKVSNNKNALDTLQNNFDNVNDEIENIKITVDKNKKDIEKLKSGQGSSGTGSGSINESELEDLKEEVALNKNNIRINAKECEDNKKSIDELKNTVDEHTKDINRLITGGTGSTPPDSENSDLLSELQATKKELEKVKLVNEDLQEELNSFCIYYEHEGTEIKEETTNSTIKIHSIKGASKSTPAPTSSNSDYKSFSHVGSKENKITLFAQNKNLFNIGDRYESLHSSGTIEKQTNDELIINSTSSSNSISIFYYIEVKPYTQYTISGEHMEKGTIKIYDGKVKTADSSKYITEVYSSRTLKAGSQFTTKSSNYITIMVYNAGSSGQNIFRKIQIEEGEEKTSYISHKERRIEISLDDGLKALPHEGYDEIEVREDGYFYLIRRVQKIEINDKLQITQNWLTDSLAQYKVFLPEGFEVKLQSNTDTNILLNSKPVKYQNEGTNNAWYSTRTLMFNFPKEMNTVELFKKWLKDNPTTMYYYSDKEEVSILDENINIKSFKGLTHFTTKNEVKPKLKVSLSRSIDKIIKELKK